MWMHVPLECLASVPASGCTTLDLAQCSMLAQSATSSGKHSAPASWLRSWKQNAWMLRLSGLTLPPSTLERGAASWIASLRACHASPIPSPASGKGTTTDAPLVRETAQSSTSFASLPSVAPPWSSSRTSQLGLLGDGFGQLATNYADWVTSSKHRSSSLRTTLAHRINASESGSWPTSRAEDSESCGNHGAASDALNKTAESWPTPKAQEDNSSPEAALVRKARAREKYEAGQYGANSGPPSMNALRRLVEKWASPTASDQNGIGLHGDGAPDLRTMASAWATPVASDDGLKVTEHSHQSGLIGQALAFSRPDLVLPSGNGSSTHRLGSRPRLNPAFTAWLMGLPWWWTNPGVTNSARSAMAAYRSALRSHGERLLGGS
jgi:hypothetical protein